MTRVHTFFTQEEGEEEGEREREKKKKTKALFSVRFDVFVYMIFFRALAFRPVSQSKSFQTSRASPYLPTNSKAPMQLEPAQTPPTSSRWKA